MPSSDDRGIEWERDRANELLGDVQTRLQQANRPRCCELLENAYRSVELALVMGRHLNPVHHTAHVVEQMVEIMLQELEEPSNDVWPDGPTPRDMEIGIVVAVFHDVGNAGEPKDEKKIRAGDVRDDPSKREPAIKARRRHMETGGIVVEAFMRRARGFSDRDIETVRKLVEHHDDPTIAELLCKSPDAESKKTVYDSLFVPREAQPPPDVPEPEQGHPLADTYPLSAVLREADRLWMLTEDGIVADLKRDLKGGKPWDPEKRIKDNTKRHKEEGELYEATFGDQTRGWAFDEDTGFYRTAVGKQRFRTWPDKLRGIRSACWADKVKEAWFI